MKSVLNGNLHHIGRVVIFSVLLITACGAGPSKRYMEGKWNVSENVCSSDPNQPQLGDIRSVIKQYESYGNSYERILNFYHNDRSIAEVSQKFNRSSSAGLIKRFDNSTENKLSTSNEFFNTRELNNEIKKSFAEFFESDPTIDAEDAHSFCLFRGQ